MFKKINVKNLVTRVLFALVILAVIISTGLLGGWFWFGVISAATLVGQWEFYRVFGIEKNPQGIVGYLVSVGYWVSLAFNRPDFMLPILVIGFVGLMMMFVIRFEKTTSEQAIASFFGIIYPVVLLSYMYRIRMLEDGIILVWLPFIGSWVADTFAYLVGILIGKHKMVPKLSPGKSWEGAVGGVLGAMLFGALFGLVIKGHFTTIQNPILACVLLCGAAAVVSIFGDLCASAFKRKHDVKDYSNLIPGHGGIMDRFDSVLFIAPAIFYLVQLFL